ncbi:MAG: hypothetical protein JO072_06305 [Parafilimonas sp.]|nr:hypothetical protein [Parafilimonas sp.]
MKKGGVFFIGLASAIATIISLNVAFGRSGYYYERYPYFSAFIILVSLRRSGYYYERYPYYNRYHHCDGRYDRYCDERSKRDERNDSAISNY